MKYKFFIYQIIVIGRKIVKPFLILTDRIRGVDFYYDYIDESVKKIGGYAYEATKARCKNSMDSFFCTHSFLEKNIMDVGCGNGI